LLSHVDRLTSSDYCWFVNTGRATFIILVDEILTHRIACDVTMISLVSAVDSYVIITFASGAVSVVPSVSGFVNFAFVLTFVMFVFVVFASAAFVIGDVGDEFLSHRAAVDGASLVASCFSRDAFAYRAVERPLVVWSGSIVVHAVVETPFPGNRSHKFLCSRGYRNACGVDNIRYCRVYHS